MVCAILQDPGDAMWANDKVIEERSKSRKLLTETLLEENRAIVSEGRVFDVR